MSISEIVGMEGDVITMQDIFVFEREGMDEDGKVIGRFRPPGSGRSSRTGSRRTGSRSPPRMFTDSPSAGGGEW
jgi:pilus assembly protein CpaF